MIVGFGNSLNGQWRMCWGPVFLRREANRGRGGERKEEGSAWRVDSGEKGSVKTLRNCRGSEGAFGPMDALRHLSSTLASRRWNCRQWCSVLLTEGKTRREDWKKRRKEEEEEERKEPCSAAKVRNDLHVVARREAR